MTEKIICAAIWVKDFEAPVHTCKNVEEGVVLCGFRHCHIICQVNTLTGKRLPELNTVQGFLTSKNRFLDREEAHKLFTENGGTPEFGDELYSEDLY